MQGAITWEAIAYFAALAAAIGGVWWKIHMRIAQVERALTDYKLEAAERFIRADHLTKMEERIVATEARTLAAIERLTARIDSLIEMGRPKPRTTRG